MDTHDSGATAVTHAEGMTGVQGGGGVPLSTSSNSLLLWIDNHWLGHEIKLEYRWTTVFVDGNVICRV